MPNIQILKPFKPILDLTHKYYIYASGRGCGKSRNIIICLIILAMQNTVRILCLREFLSTIDESIKSEMEKAIEKMQVNNFFTITKTEIIGKNGSKFLFRGIRSANAIGIKSISDINITFVEEAETISEKSWEYLIPSVMRQHEGINMVICALNPRFDEDVIYDRFFNLEPPKNSFVCFLTQEDNPFFEKSNMKEQMEHDRKILPSSQFSNKWLGKTINFDDDCIFTPATFDLIKRPFDKDIIYDKIVIGVDPAMTHSQKSNMYGIIVVGLSNNDEYHILNNLTDHHTPFSFAEAVKDAYYKYNADAIVVETNAGGDFIKSTLLFSDANLIIKEVRAVNDKMKRAMPVANIAALGKIKIADLNRNLLIRQMRCSTVRGYMGPQGESPDALDAMCWAIYELANVRGKESQNTVFKIDEFMAPLDLYPFMGPINSFICLLDNEIAFFKFRICEDNNLNKCWQILECEVIERKNFNNYAMTGICYLPDLDYKWDLSNTSKDIFLYDFDKNFKIDNLVQEILPALSLNKINLACVKNSFYNNFNGNILLNELKKFKLDNAENKRIIIILLFCSFIKCFML